MGRGVLRRHGGRGRAPVGPLEGLWTVHRWADAGVVRAAGSHPPPPDPPELRLFPLPFSAKLVFRF